MKQPRRISLFIALTMVLSSLICKAQCDNDVNNTVGVHYVYSPRGQGVGGEIGWTAGEMPISLHMNIDVFIRPQLTDQEINDGEMGCFGRVYTKVGVRIVRIPWRLSIYADMLGGLDSGTGFYCGGGIKFLVPLDQKAISIEPMYVNKEFNIQATLHFII